MDTPNGLACYRNGPKIARELAEIVIPKHFNVIGVISNQSQQFGQARSPEFVIVLALTCVHRNHFFGSITPPSCTILQPGNAAWNASSPSFVTFVLLTLISPRVLSSLM